ncbi:MAG: DUF4340 domain-containing protein [bacterium]
MKNFTSSFALLLVLIIVSAYIYFVEYPSYKKRQNDKIFFTGEVVDANILNNETGKNITLVLKDGAWLINDKKSEDPKAINTMLYVLKGKKEKDIAFAPKQIDIEKYGLVKPVMIITVKDSQGTSEEFDIGAKTQVGFGRYIWLKKKNVLVVSSDIYESFAKELK